MVPNWLLIVVSVVAGVGGQVSIKWGVTHAAPFKLPFMVVLPTMFQSPLTLLGLALYGLGAISWIAVLKRMDLSYAYPFLALNFVLIALVSGFFLGEAIPPLRWAGLGLICCGIVLVSFGAAP
ncbi:MAG: EamA family transporter [Caldilineaceae bacterium]